MKLTVSRLIFILSLLIMLVQPAFLKAQNTEEQGPWNVPQWADTLTNNYTSTEDVQEGQELYDIYCWTCHGETGLGDGPAGGSLPIPPRNFKKPDIAAQSDGALYWKLTNGRGNMVAYEELLTEAQRWQLVTYIRQLQQEE